MKPITGCKGFGAKFREGEFVNYLEEVELQSATARRGTALLA